MNKCISSINGYEIKDANARANVENIKEDVSVLTARVDENIATSEENTEGNTELIDIRVDHEGRTHATAGESVRSQARNINEKFDSSFELVLLTNNILPPDTESGYYDTSLNKVAGSIYCRTPKPIALKSATQIVCSTNMQSEDTGDQLNIIFIGGNGEYISLKTFRPASAVSVGYSTIPIPSNAVSFVAYIQNKSGLGYTMANFCISYTVLPESINRFEEYSAKYVIKETALKDYMLQAVGQTITNTLYGKKIVNFGDSIFGNYTDATSISKLIQLMTKATVYNCGFGGTRMAFASSGAASRYFSMTEIADAITSKDFSVLETGYNEWVNSSSPPSSNVRTVLNTLKTIDFNDIDIITIEHGTNDYAVSIDLDNANNKKDKYCFGSALRYSIEKILTAYPHIRIFLCTQTFRYWVTNGEYTDSNTVENLDGNLLTDFVAKVKEIANEYNIPCIDNYFTLGINEFTKSIYFDSTDGTHPNAKGRELIAKHIVKELY